MTSAIYTIWLREMKRYVRNRPRIIGSIMMPVMYIGIMGIGLSSSFKLPNANFDYLTFMSPGIIAMSLLFTSIFSAISVIWDRQFGFMKEMMVAPISRSSIILGKILGSATISVITGLMVLVIAIILRGVHLDAISPISIVEMALAMVFVSIPFVSIGLLIAMKMNTMEGFQVIMTSLVMPLFFLSGAFFPIQNAPTWMKVLSHADPMMYGVDALRSILINFAQYSLTTDLLVLAGFSIATVTAVSYIFSKVE